MGCQPLKNYLVTIIYNSDKEIVDDEYNHFIDSFNIKDVSIDTNIKQTIIFILIFGTTLGIIGYFVSVFKKKH